MNSVIYNPLEEFENKFKNLHLDKTNAFFAELTKKSGVNIAENQKTVADYNIAKENSRKLKTKLNWLRFFRVLMCITIILIPIVIMKMTPKIREKRAQIADIDNRVAELYNLAMRQMAPLNNLFTDRDALNIIESTMPLVKFENYFSAKQESDMAVNYDFVNDNNIEQSTLEVLAGHYNENPFLFENRMIHRMGTEIYHGYKTIHWTETYRDSDGKLRTRTRSQTLHATVSKPKPFYSTMVVLNYCAQGAPDLSFTRDASNLHVKSEKQIERHVKRGEKKLNKMTEKAVSNNQDFMSMSNTEFEVLFDALDRNNEVQFRTMFTPLAQTNMVDLIRSNVGYGDDFNFIKARRTNKIISNHSQGRVINLLPAHYVSHSYDIIKSNFIGKNTEFFKAVYFDFAPVLAIPMYQERPVHSLKPIPDYSQMYSLKESEALANAVDPRFVAHPATKTPVILKSAYIGSKEKVDENRITAYSYDIVPQIDYIPQLGGDGRVHMVPVPWDLYIPLEAQNSFYISSDEFAQNKNIIARRNGLCIFN